MHRLLEEPCQFSFKKGSNSMTKRLNHCAILLTIAVLLSVNLAQAQTRDGSKREVDRTAAIPGRLKVSELLAQARVAKRPGFALMPSRNLGKASSPAFSFTLMAGPNLPVVGSGTVGRLTKWTAVTSSNSFIGDSTIFESKLGLVGIGTDTPTSKLTVAGTIQSLSGGFQFPDGTVQTTAGIAPNQVVRSLNGLMGDLTLVPGANVTITPGANSLTIATSGLLSGVSHDATLKGNGTIGDPLGVAIPLILSGSVDSGPSNTVGIIQLTNTDILGVGISALAETAVLARGVDDNVSGGIGVSAEGGNGKVIGGFGVFARGGSSDLRGGVGVDARGGNGDSDAGGRGVDATGGSSTTANGGTGVGGEGGESRKGNGGRGVFAVGGRAINPGHNGGIGIEATGGEGIDGATPGLAGKFNGDVEVTGTLSKGGGSFKIDHPLDPENRYLYHSFVESPDMKNIYDGNIVTDANGEATITLPEYFEALNRDFRYQLTVIGAFAQATVADEIRGNRFVIRTSAPNVKVSWQVTGIRHDRWADKNRIPNEVQKSERERGYYLHPEAFNQPEERGLEWALDPELMQQRKLRRIESKQRRNDK